MSKKAPAPKGRPLGDLVGDILGRNRKFLKPYKSYAGLIVRPGDRVSYDYPIAHSRMDTPEKLLGWIRHLCAKGWVTREHIRALIHHAESIGVKVDLNS